MIRFDTSAVERLPSAGPAGVVARCDWNMLFRAVQDRLQRGAGNARAEVLDCVSALDQLHATLTYELGRQAQLESELAETRAALVQAQAELADVRAGRRLPMPALNQWPARP